MSSRTFLAAAITVVASCQPAFSQTFDSCGNCVTPSAVTSANTGLVALQSQIISTRTIPVTARLLTSRVVAMGYGPSTQYSQFGSFSTFGAASVPVGSQFVSNSTGFVPTASTFGFPSTVGVPATMTLPSTFTLSVPQGALTTPFAVASPGVEKVLAGRIASENCRSAATRVQSTPQSCCSTESKLSMPGSQSLRKRPVRLQATNRTTACCKSLEAGKNEAVRHASKSLNIRAVS
jgi:hypothetical protein